MPSYRLDEENWIPVVTADGRAEYRSLRSVFEDAPKIRRLAGSPPEVAVLHRLLLAIIHRVMNPQTAEDWLKAWHDRAQIMQAAAHYVVKHSECFDLYDPDRPFMQHPALPPGQKPVTALLYDRAQGNNPIFLDASNEAEPFACTSAEAARGILVNCAFGGSHPDHGNPLKIGDKQTMYAGPLCARIVAIVEGDDLAKTLVLNLVVGEPTGRPAWERPLPPHPGKTEPEGISDRYTRQTRFIRLQPTEDGQFCAALALHMGEQIAEEEDRPSDPMMPLYLARDKKLKVQRLEPGRALWRSGHILFNCRTTADAEPIRALEQLNPHVQFGDIDRSEPVSLRIVGVAGNAQGPTTDMWRDESLPFSLSLIADDAQFAQLVQALRVAEESADRLRGRLFGFADRYLSVLSPAHKKEDAGKLVNQIAPGLADFWGAIGPKGERLAAAPIDAAAWEQVLDEAAHTAYHKAIEALPPTAPRLRAQFAFSKQPNSRSNTPA